MTDTFPQTRTKRGLDLVTAADLADLFHELSHNPKTRKVIAKAVKAAKPDSPHAQAFSDVELEDKFEDFRSKQEEKDLQRRQEEMIAQMNAKRAALLNGGQGGGRKYSEDDVKNIEELMEKKGIIDYEDGATLYAATLPPVDPQPGRDIPYQHGTTWEFPEWARFSDNPQKAARDTAHQVITEFMRKR